MLCYGVMSLYESSCCTPVAPYLSRCILSCYGVLPSYAMQIFLVVLSAPSGDKLIAVTVQPTHALDRSPRGCHSRQRAYCVFAAGVVGWS